MSVSIQHLCTRNWYINWNGKFTKDILKAHFIPQLISWLISRIFTVSKFKLSTYLFVPLLNLIVCKMHQANFKFCLQIDYQRLIVKESELMLDTFKNVCIRYIKTGLFWVQSIYIDCHTQIYFYKNKGFMRLLGQLTLIQFVLSLLSFHIFYLIWPCLFNIPKPTTALSVDFTKSHQTFPNPTISLLTSTLSLPS